MNLGAANSNPTLQHYLTNNHITNDPQNGMKNVHVQIVKQEQQAQQRYIINRQYIQNPIQQPKVIPELPYWLIVEMEPNSEINSYAFVESKDVIGNPPLASLSTGKLLIININNKQRQASVVMAGTDKNFIIAEYNQLTKIAEDNLKLRESQVRKRRRISGSDMGRKDPEDDSSLSAWSGVSQNVNSERVVSPSPHLQTRKSIYDNKYCAPMNYDQGTQTDPRFTGSSSNSAEMGDKLKELQRLIEQVLSEQKQQRNETKMNQHMIESFTDEFSSLRKSLQLFENKFDNWTIERPQYEALSQDVHITDKKMTKILNGSENVNGNQPYFIIETAQDGGENASMSLTGSNVEYAVEELEADDSGRSTSRMSYHDQASMMSNSSMDGKAKSFRRSHSSSNFSVVSSTPLTRSNSSSNLVEEWNDIEGEVAIGSNQTFVPVHILRSIDWKNYKTATRKLLVSLFPRAILASRSLTGRPSPAFHDRNKPVKEKLDQNIINDIIQIITRKCGVHESQVRTAITTKCADENKMMRNREGKSKNDGGDERSFKAPSDMNLSNVVDNKENIHGNN